jgi:CRISPR/Cas system-associated exonuclease Cas4 (RecB family)
MNFTWSFSSLKEYVNCPRQYQELKVLKRFEKKATEQMLYGTVVHKACEDYVASGKPLDKNYLRFKPVLDELIAIPGTKYSEHEMALKADKTPCEFADPTRWVRGIVDLLIVDGEQAYIIDYKTGSNRYPDPKQLKLMALMTFAHFPKVQKIKAGLLFVMHESFMDEEYTRHQIPKLWSYFSTDLERLNISYENDIWNPNPTPLCGWCPVKSCEFHKER